MKLGPVTKLDKKNINTSKYFEDDVMSANYDVIVIFIIINLFKRLTANSSQLEQTKYVYICLSKQYITSTSKTISIKRHSKQQRISLWMQYRS